MSEADHGSDELQTTALTALHEAAGAKMAPFAGWAMPLEYAGTVAEHEAVRTAVGVFDVSHLGTVLVGGAGATATLAASFTGDCAAVDVGSSRYMLCCDERGGIVDDLIVYRLGADDWMVVPNAANTAAVLARLHAVAAAGDADVAIDDRSTDYAILAVQGPEALATASHVLGIDVAAVAYLGIERVAVDGEDAVLCRTGYTGEPGCEIVVPNAAAAGLWQALLAAGATPVGLGARDTLRLEMGYPLHGNDLSVDVNPYEARLGWAVKLDHGDFVGRDALVAIKAAGPTRRLLGLLGESRRPLRAGMSVRADGVEVGTLTSGGFSPTLGVGIGMGLLDAAIAPGTALVVDVRGRDVPVQAVVPPFVDVSPRA